MRISDWSSDVCSSDLSGLADRFGAFEEVLGEALVAQPAMRARLVDHPAVGVADPRLFPAFRIEQHVEADITVGGVDLDKDAAQIGREAGRERVGKYG